MSVTIDLPPDLEANLAAQAAARGVPLAEHLRHVLEEQAGASKAARKTPEERAKFWRESVKGVPIRNRSPMGRSAGRASTPSAGEHSP